MSADLFSNFLGITLQATGNNNNAWGTILNASGLQVVEKAIAGNVTHAVTGGTLDLTSPSVPPSGITPALELVQIFSGVLTSKQIIQMPNLSKAWCIVNGTTGSFPLHVKTTTGSPVQVPQGTGKYLICDGNNNIFRLDRDTVGNFVYAANTPADALQCNGQSLLKTDYPDLYGAIGTAFGTVDSLHFTLPLLTDTGRFLRSVSGAITLGTYHSNQNKSHTHTGSGTTGNQNANHTHDTSISGTTGTDSPDHSHSLNGTWTAGVSEVGSGPSSPPAIKHDGPNIGPNTAGASARHAHSFSGSGTSGTESAIHQHTFAFTTSTGSADGAEARPEALAVVISIRY